MIQTIGFLLCVYMLVRGLDIRSRVEDRKSKASAMLANLAAVIAIVGAVIFFVILVDEGNASPTLDSPPFTAVR
jgi:uncharacterized membrane protein